MSKIILLGDINTGKTSFVKKLLYDIYTPGYYPTIGVQKYKKDDWWFIDVGNEDISNCENSFIGIIFVDVTRESTLENVVKYKNIFKASNPDAPIILAVNKIDKIKEVSIETIKTASNYDDFCNQHHINSWFFTSSVSGQGIREILHYISKHNVDFKQFEEISDFVNQLLSFIEDDYIKFQMKYIKLCYEPNFRFLKLKNQALNNMIIHINEIINTDFSSDIKLEMLLSYLINNI